MISKITTSFNDFILENVDIKFNLANIMAMQIGRREMFNKRHVDYGVGIAFNIGVFKIKKYVD